VAVAQLVESRIVIPVVVGSNPISHPNLKLALFVFIMKFITLLFILTTINNCSSKYLSKIDNIDFNRYGEKKYHSNYEQLENYESYRPSSWHDATRNPFMKKRYQFIINE
jgi:hypothetical protein